jgi:glycosyltransferase involved in cell wall biosynthesis
VREAARVTRAVIAEEGADLLNVHFAYPALGLHFSSPRDLPIVRTFHGSWAAESRVEEEERKASLSLKWLAEAISLRGSRRVIVLSEFSRQIVTREFGVPVERADLVPGGVDLERFHPGDRAEARERLGLPAGRRILLTVRRLVPRMGLDALLDAMRRVCDAHPKVLLLVGGTGPLAAELRRRAVVLGLEGQVRFLGFIPDEELVTYYQAAEAFVLPTRALEGFGLPTLEAFACGVPVLGTPVGATPELLRQVEPALILPGTSSEDLAAGLLSFLAAPLPAACASPPLRAFVERNYSWERAVDETLAVFEHALCEGSSMLHAPRSTLKGGG